MKKTLYFLPIILIAIFVISSCTREEDENAFFQIEQKGAVAVISNTSGFFNLLDPGNSSVSFDLGTKGEPVTSMDISKRLKGGTITTLKTISTFPSNVSISFNEALAGSGYTVADLAPGDQVEFRTMLSTATGTYPGQSAIFEMSCPSDLGGDYDVVSVGTSTDGCCPGQHTVNTTVTLSDNGGGKYTISDWSGGLYIEWYTVYGITPENMVGEVSDICNNITLTGPAQEPFGESLEGSGTLDPITGIITFSWKNGYDDQGTLTMTPK
jgi:hypothetical protein